MNLAPIICVLLCLITITAHGQAPGVPVYAEGRGARPLAALAKSAKKLRESGGLLSAEKAREQYQRSSCVLSLPSCSTQKLDSREIWNLARKAHLRVGWLYLCNDCDDQWHLGLSGGYAITADAVATCAHVVEPLEMREGYLVAADDDDNLYAVTEVLAMDRARDTAIVKLKAANLSPLPLARDVLPGDTVYCFSDPVDRRGYFSQGMVNRFVKRPFLRKKDLLASDKEKDKGQSSTPAATSPPSAAEAPVWIVVSTDWAPGSSGSAVLDGCGNAIGHVSEIEAILEDSPSDVKRPKARARGTVIIFHDAIAASNVLSLIKPPTPPAPPVVKTL